MKGLKTASVLFTLLFLTACVTIQTSPPWPLGSEPVVVKVIPSNIALNDFSVGGYRVEGTGFVVTSGRQMSQAEGGFGLLGVMSAHGQGKEEAKKQLAGHESALRINLSSGLDQAFKAALAPKTRVRSQYSLIFDVGCA